MKIECFFTPIMDYSSAIWGYTGMKILIVNINMPCAHSDRVRRSATKISSEGTMDWKTPTICCN